MNYNKNQVPSIQRRYVRRRDLLVKIATEKRERIIPDIERLGEKHKVTGEQNWEDVPANSAMEGLLLPRRPGKDYRLLKAVAQPAAAEQLARLGNDRVPVFFNRSCAEKTL